MEKAKQFSPNRAKTKGSFSLRSNKKETGRAKGYGVLWEKFRWKFLHYNKHCYVCNGESKVVDHIRSHKGDMELFWNEKNYMPLCTVCHNRITGMFDRTETPRTKEKVAWINRQRELNGVKVVIKVVPFGKLLKKINKSKGDDIE